MTPRPRAASPSTAKRCSDPNGIAAASGPMGISDGESAEAKSAKSRAHDEEQVPLLLFRTGSGIPMAVPLALVARLEEIERKTIERSNDRWVVQYRGQLMPLIPMSHEQEMGGEKEGRQPVLVFADREKSMGLMVDEIV